MLKPDLELFDLLIPPIETGSGVFGDVAELGVFVLSQIGGYRAGMSNVIGTSLIPLAVANHCFTFLSS